MSLTHPWCESRGSTLTARNFTFRLVNSLLILATAPSSVVQTGVKSAGCEKSTPQLSPSHWWKFTSPSVLCAVKLGAVSPNLNAMLLLVLMYCAYCVYYQTYKLGPKATLRKWGVHPIPGAALD